MVDICQKSFFKTSISRNHAYRVLHRRFPPFGFVLKPVWSIHMFLNMIMADSSQKSFFKTSISRYHAYRVLHSRFSPFGFVLKPVWLVHMSLGELWQIRVESGTIEWYQHPPPIIINWMVTPNNFFGVIVQLKCTQSLWNYFFAVQFRLHRRVHWVC